MKQPHQLPKIVWDEAARVLYIGDMAISATVLAAVVDPDKRVLWRFAWRADKVEAIPFSEKHVVWLDEEPEESKP